MALIDDLLIQAQRDLAAREQLIVRQLLDRYGVALRRIERELRTIDAQLAELIASESDITEQIIRRQRWWREVEASIQREMARWSNDAAQGLAALQTGGVRVGVAVASEIAKAAGTPFQGRVYASAFERWVSAIQPGSPVRNVIDGYGGRVSESILQRMTEGIGGGKAPRSIVREVMADVGGVGSEARIMSLARTETMRSFRGASADTYAKLPDGVITGYRWKSAHDERVCVACLALDGTITKTYPTKQHVNCRCIGIPLVSDAIVPGANRGGETGAEWFAKQDEKTQRRILLSDGRYDAYKSGTPISDMVTVRHSDVWGDSIGIKPMSLTGQQHGLDPKTGPMALDADGIDAIVDREEYVVYGLRSSSRDHAVGSTLEPSQIWDDGVPTGEYLDGTSVLAVGGEGMRGTSARALKLSNDYEGDYISIVGGDRFQLGEDTLEIIIEDPTVLYSWRRRAKS